MFYIDTLLLFSHFVRKAIWDTVTLASMVNAPVKLGSVLKLPGTFLRLKCFLYLLAWSGHFLHFQSLFDMTYCTIHTLLLCYIRALGIYVISKISM